jgi:hypothetical protein
MPKQETKPLQLIASGPLYLFANTQGQSVRMRGGHLLKMNRAVTGADPWDGWARIDSRFRPPEAHTSTIAVPPPRGIAGDRECCAPARIEGSIMPQSQSLSSVVPFAAIGRPACPNCKASMRLVSVELAGPGVDLQTFQCAVCNHLLTTLAAYEDPMHSKALGRWLQGDLYPPK